MLYLSDGEIKHGKGTTVYYQGVIVRVMGVQKIIKTKEKSAISSKQKDVAVSDL